MLISAVGINRSRLQSLLGLLILLCFSASGFAENEPRALPPGNSADQISDSKLPPVPATSLQPSATDTLRFDFSSDLQGWGYTTPADSVLEFYPVLVSPDSCAELNHNIGISPPFGLVWSSFGGTGTAEMQAKFQGYNNGFCDYRWWVKSISGAASNFSGADRLEARVYKPSGGTMYAAITYLRSGDTDFQFQRWIGPLPTGTWTTIQLAEPTPGAFDKLVAVAVLFGAYNYQSSIYVDEVRAIKTVISPPTLVSPANNADIQDNLPTFTWTGDGISYNLQIATDSLFTTPTNYSLITGSSYTLTTPLPNSGGYNDIHYYWRMQANYAGGVTSAYSPYRRLDISGPHEVPSEFPTIRAAYNAFQSFSGGEVLVAPGTYTGADNCNIGSFGEKPVDVVSSGGPTVTIIDCQGDYPGFNYDLYSVPGTLLQGFTIRNAAGGDGAAVVCWTGSPTIRNCIIETSSQWGIYCRSGSTAKIENTIVRNCAANGLMIDAGANPQVSGCQFVGNSGANIYLASTTQATITNTEILNAAVLPDFGSVGIVGSGSSLTVSGCTFSNPIGSGLALESGDLTVRNCSFTQHSESVQGGGLIIRTSTENSVSIDASFFSNNSAPAGGGIYLVSVGTIDITNTTLANNSTGIYVDPKSSVVTLQIDNSVISGSSGGPGINPTTGFIDSFGITCTDIFGNKGGDWIAPFTGLLGSNGNIAADPLFCDPSLGDFHLADTSPCASKNSGCGQMGVYGVACSFNLPPQWVLVQDTTISENQTLSQTVIAEDPDETIPILTTGSLPNNATFKDNQDGTGTLKFAPDFDQAGEYTILFMASDGEFVDSAEAVVTVLNVNRPPEFTSAADDSVAEGETLDLTVSATDPDNTTPLLSAENLPSNSSFVDHGNGSGTLTFNPDFGQEGDYIVRFIASDGELADTAIVNITVLGSDRPPVIEPIADVTVDEGEPLQINVSASDPDETIPLLSVLNSPVGASFSDNGDGTGDFSWTPGFDQSGVYLVTFQASDGVFTVGADVTITVRNINRAPTWVDAADASVQAGQNLDLTVTAIDPDGTVPLLSAFDLPTNAQFLDNGDGSGLLSFTPDYTQVGSYEISLVASDGELADTAVVLVTVTPGAVLSVEPTSILLEPDANETSFTIANTGQATLEWSASSDQEWLTLMPQSGTLAASENTAVTVSIDLEGLTAGQYIGHIEVTSNAGTQLVTTTATKSLAVLTPPILSSVYVIDTITVPFNGIVPADSLLLAVSISSSHGRSYETQVMFDSKYTYLDILPPTGEGFAELDSVGVHIQPDLTNDQGVPLLSGDTVRTVLTGAVVWPGDTDRDGIVDERDILPIGRNFGVKGPPRALQGTAWLAHHSHAILGGSFWQPYSAIYADADGDGEIADQDVCAIADNWSDILTRESSTDKAAQQLDTATLKRILKALVDCPESQGRKELIDYLESLLGDNHAQLPTAPQLYQNHPNPFNPSTQIEFWLPRSGKVSLEVFNIEGRRVRRLAGGFYPAGAHTFSWDGKDENGSLVASGIYFYKVVSGEYQSVRKMILLK